MKLLAVALAAAATLVALPAKAELVCDVGDVAVGPNCVHTERKADEHIGEWVHSTVYRWSGWTEKTIVWGRDVGEVVYSTPKYLAVRVTLQGSGGGPSEELVTYTWNGTVYE